MPTIRQISATITNPDPGIGSAGAWTNPANVRDSGNPPVVNGTDATFADATVDPVNIVRAMKFHSPTLTDGLMWVGVTVDWSATGDANCSCVLKVVDRGGFYQQLQPFSLKGGDARIQRVFPLADLFGPPPGRYYYRGDEDLRITAQASLGAGSTANFRIYEIGYLYAPRIDSVVVPG